MGVLFAAPGTYLAVRLTVGDGDLLGTLGSRDVLRPLINSVTLAAAVTAAATTLGVALALVVARTDLPGRSLLRVLLPLPLAMPSFVAATALIAATGRGGLLGWLDRPVGFGGAFWVLTVLTYPYVLLPVLAALSAVSGTMEEAARLLGRGPLVVLWRVVLPQLRPAMVAGGLLVFLYVLSDFGAVALLRFDTVTRVIYESRLLNRELSLTLGALLAVLALAVAWAARASPATTPVTTTRGGRPPEPVRVGRWRVPLLGAVWAVLGVALLAPVAVFVTWAVRGSTAIGLGYSGVGDDLSFLLAPARGTVVSGVGAAVATTLVVLPVAFATARRPSAAGRLVAALVTSVFALPGLVVALALASWAVASPTWAAGLYQSLPLLLLGYVLHFGAQGLGASQAAFSGVPRQLDEAAAVLGAGPWRRLVRVDLPLVLPGLLAGAGLVLLSTMKELPITLLLAPTGFRTLATSIWNAAADGFWAQVGVTSLCLLSVSAVLTWVLVLRQAPGVRGARAPAAH